MSDLVQQAGSAGAAAEGYGAYGASSFGASAAASSMPFVLPTEERNEDSGGGQHSGDDLAKQYDLSRHLDGDRTTFSDTASGGAITGKAVTASAGGKTSDTTGAAADTPVLSSSRALGAATASTARAPNATATENLAERGYISSARTLGTQGGGASKNLHSIGAKQLAYPLTTNGTIVADTERDMVSAKDIVENLRTGPATGLVGAIRVVRDADNQTGGESAGKKREDRQNDDRNAMNAGALSATDDTGTSAAPVGDKVETPCMKQVSDAVLEQMERMSTEPGNNIRLTLDMDDGSKLDLRLRWNGSRVKASFDGAKGAVRDEIENGWASLSLNVGNSGMQLEPPSFGGIA
jgi:hypothetical protein